MSPVLYKALSANHFSGYLSKRSPRRFLIRIQYGRIRKGQCASWHWSCFHWFFNKPSLLALHLHITAVLSPHNDLKGSPKYNGQSCWIWSDDPYADVFCGGDNKDSLGCPALPLSLGVSLPRRAASSPAREQLHIRVWEWGRWGAHSMHTHPHPLPPCLALWTGRHLWSLSLNFPSHFQINVQVGLQVFL